MTKVRVCMTLQCKMRWLQRPGSLVSCVSLPLSHVTSFVTDPLSPALTWSLSSLSGGYLLSGSLLAILIMIA